ncbi:uncharacterized protein RAG0_04167 [Rhynchosporium agropyri]|uniref:Uncharacterized protein n=1 Tax=Rhynchosporium agropyri TaxID=914238 RepID=A0A1E1KBQ8_9HELO|nr:uncharacterized protein RAG0_04167 [Rhynchosporium agropyri]
MSLMLAGVYLVHPIWAAPTPNITALRNTIAPAFVGEPHARRTWSLLNSCSFTLLLCVYTATHLNVKGHYDTKGKVWRRKAKWAAIAIFALEILVYVAFEQWTFARRFLKELKTMADESTDENIKKRLTENPKEPPFDMVYAHYILMGGFAVHVDKIHNTVEVITVTTGDIGDKSKADVLAKSLVCVQVLWVVGQAIERKATGYPMGLLEVHTIVHVVCALLMYALWFQKPFNDQSPQFLSWVGT